MLAVVTYKCFLRRNTAHNFVRFVVSNHYYYMFHSLAASFQWTFTDPNHNKCALLYLHQ